MKQSNPSKARRKISHSELWAWAEETLSRQRVSIIGVSSSKLQLAQDSLELFTDSLESEGWLKLSYNQNQTADLEAWLSAQLLEFELRFHIPKHVELESHHQSTLNYEQAKPGQTISNLLSGRQKTADGTDWAGFQFELPDDWSVIDENLIQNESTVEGIQASKSTADNPQELSCLEVLQKLSTQRATVMLFSASNLMKTDSEDADNGHNFEFLANIINHFKTNRKDHPILIIWLNPYVELDDSVDLNVQPSYRTAKQVEESLLEELTPPKPRSVQDFSESVELNFDRVFQETFNAQAELAPIELSLDQSIQFDEFTDDPLVQISLGHVPLTVFPKAGSEEVADLKEQVQDNHQVSTENDQSSNTPQDLQQITEPGQNNAVLPDQSSSPLDSKPSVEYGKQSASELSSSGDSPLNPQESDYTTTELPALTTTSNFSSLERAQFSQCAQLAHEYFGPQALFLSAASICGPTCSMGQVTAVWKGVVDRPLDETNSFNEQLWESLSAALSGGILRETHHQRFLTEPSFRFNQAKMTKFWRRRLETLLSTRLIRRAFRNLANWMALQSVNPVARPQVTLSVIDLWIEAGEMAQASQSSLHVAKLFLERGDGSKAKKALQKTIQLLGPDGHWPTWRECFELLLKLTVEAGDELAIEMICKQFIERAWRVGDLALIRKLTQLLEKLYKKTERYQDAEYLGEWSASQPFVDQATALFDAPLTIYPEALIEEAVQTQPDDQAQNSPISLAPNAQSTQYRDGHDQLNSTMPKEVDSMSLPDIHTLEAPPAYLLEALVTLRDHGYEAYVVGGSVRDRLLGREVNDWDLTTNALPNEVIECFDKVIETGIEHGTVTVVLHQEHIEITTYRVDGDYTDGRRPEEVSFTRSLKEDLLRRDFTINAIAWDPIDARIQDPYYGCKDLQAKCLRAVGSTSERFKEDGLRVLRAIRFATVLDFTIDPDTQIGATAALDTLKRVAAERVQVELFKTLNSPQPGRGLKLIREFGVEEVCFPNQALISDAAWFRIADALNVCNGTLVSRLALILHGIQAELQLSQVQFAQNAQATFKALKLSNKLSQQSLKLLSFSTLDPEQERKAEHIRALAVEIGIEQLEHLWAYQRAWSETENSLERKTRLLAAWQELESKMIDLDVAHTPKTPKDLDLNGNDLCKALDIFPSRAVGDILNDLLRWVWADPQRNRHQVLIEQARLIATQRGII